jgi:4-oxalocrotonate tautomerase
MPLLQLDHAGVELTLHQTRELQQGLTRLMADVLRKEASLTVVAIRHQDIGAWSVDGQACEGAAWSASLLVFVTAGTNTPDEIAAFIADADRLIRATLGSDAATPLYIVVKEVDSRHWGYDGRSQQARRQAG